MKKGNTYKSFRTTRRTDDDINYLTRMWGENVSVVIRQAIADAALNERIQRGLVRAKAKSEDELLNE